MKHVKSFERLTSDEVFDIFKDTYNQNPLKEDHDFYIFLAGEKFEEAENGLYKKVLDIENMVRIKLDKESVGAMQGLKMRAMTQQGVKMYHIWLPNDIRELVDGKGSNSIESWLVDLIDKHKQTGSDDHGKKIYKEVINKHEEREKIKKDSNRYNI
jgi:hypothetical protein